MNDRERAETEEILFRGPGSLLNASRSLAAGGSGPSTRVQSRARGHRASSEREVNKEAVAFSIDEPLSRS